MFSSSDENTNYNQGGYIAQGTSEPNSQYYGSSTMPPNAHYYNQGTHNQQMPTQSQNAYGNAQQPYVDNL